MARYALAPPLVEDRRADQLQTSCRGPRLAMGAPATPWKRCTLFSIQWGAAFSVRVN